MKFVEYPPRPWPWKNRIWFSYMTFRNFKLGDLELPTNTNITATSRMSSNYLLRSTLSPTEQ